MSGVFAHELQQRLEAAQHAQRVRRVDARLSRRDRQPIRLVLAQLLHRPARCRGLHDEGRAVARVAGR